ncbi:hypothetical protein CTAM01_17022 [Colletotrichum tamarilloi]|uniref:C2H2-type domain-containing protein n=1 Tax=Colletotrichum tamarilloi TaxID=1209934 RepID=A0ABQ9QGU5_9PEZI|nr:uncharacterized protein CTAM01_17022 [Colletotrichum tamarilloi]KAK1466174.1 hypothetical protein CTAM01_17022 [Colletotrichum tamarilloi]
MATNQTWLVATIRYSSTPAPTDEVYGIRPFSFSCAALLFQLTDLGSLPAAFSHFASSYPSKQLFAVSRDSAALEAADICRPGADVRHQPSHVSHSSDSQCTELPGQHIVLSASTAAAPRVLPPVGWYSHSVQAYRASFMRLQPTMASSSRWLTAPGPTSGHGLPAMRPVAVDSITPQPDENSSDGRGGVVSNGIDEAERPTHAVGSQGRWSLLCSASRCAAVNTSRTYNAKSIFDLIKNVGGKFPCPHCNKVYKRKSNLKLHLLRPLSQNHGLNHSNGPDIMPADGTVQSDGMMPVPDRSSNHTHHRRQSSPSLRPDKLDDGGHHDGRHSTDSAIDTSGQVCKMQKYDMPPVQYEMVSKDGPDVDQQSGLDEIQFCHTSVQQAHETRIQLPPVGATADKENISGDGEGFEETFGTHEQMHKERQR